MRRHRRRRPRSRRNDGEFLRWLEHGLQGPAPVTRRPPPRPTASHVLRVWLSDELRARFDDDDWQAVLYVLACAQGAHGVALHHVSGEGGRIALIFSGCAPDRFEELLRGKLDAYFEARHALTTGCAKSSRTTLRGAEEIMRAHAGLVALTRALAEQRWRETPLSVDGHDYVPRAA